MKHCTRGTVNLRRFGRDVTFTLLLLAGCGSAGQETQSPECWSEGVVDTSDGERLAVACGECPSDRLCLIEDPSEVCEQVSDNLWYCETH